MRTITYDQYFDKVRGGWIGKCLGGTIGCFEGTKRITNLNIYDLLPEKMAANDDLDLQLIWMDVLLEKGINFTSSHLMEAWLEEYDYNFGEYATGRRNYRRGLKPPVCGRYANRFFITGMGCPIRSEIWGMIAPGSSDLAAEYAYKDGILDHEGESVWAEQFLAVMESAAFFEDDLWALIDEGLKYVPKDTILYRCIMEACEGYKKGHSWQETWKLLRDNYGHPDCTYSPQNLGIITMALLYGEKDFDRTLTIAVNSGWDVDCTCSTTAALLGIIKGYRGFDSKWLEYIGDEIVTMAEPKNPMHSVRLLTEYTCRAGVTIFNACMSDIIITDIPSDIKLLKTDSYEGCVTLKADYCGEPVIKATETKQMKLIVKNNSREAVEGKLVFTRIPDAFDVSFKSDRQASESDMIDVDRQGAVTANVYIRANNCTSVLNDTNIFECAFIENGVIIDSLQFGLCGAPEALVIGPYYDTYMDWLNAEDMPANRIIRSGDETVVIPEASDEWGSHRADIDKPYVSEDFANPDQTKALFGQGRISTVIEDKYVLKDAFGFQGTACAYFYQEIHCHEDREGSVFIGSSDPYRLWINGELVCEQRENRFWYPNHDVVDMKFKKGMNQIVLKIARKGADNQFTMAFRHKRVHPGFDSAPYMTDLSFSVFSNH